MITEEQANHLRIAARIHNEFMGIYNGPAGIVSIENTVDNAVHLTERAFFEMFDEYKIREWPNRPYDSMATATFEDTRYFCIYRRDNRCSTTCQE
jgi:hypothetical protein